MIFVDHKILFTKFLHEVATWLVDEEVSVLDTNNSQNVAKILA